MKWTLLALVFAVLFGARRAGAQQGVPEAPGSLAALDRRLADIFEAHQVPGASVVVVENGSVALSNGYGTADRKSNRRVTPETPFRAGSISKSITGIAVMLLVEDGKLSLDTPLSVLAPEIPFDNPWEKTDPVRLGHLLEHTSGFQDLRFRQYALDGHDMPLRHAVEVYGPYKARWRPGDHFSYSNVGPTIAGYIVEKISGMSFADFTRQRIFAPLGMASARWDKPTDGPALPQSYWGPDLREAWFADIPGKPAGALIVTAGDLAKLAGMLMGRGAFNGTTLLKPESVARIETPATSLAARAGLKVGYGLGVFATVDDKAVFHGHNGAIDGFFAEYRYETERGAAAVVMINATRQDALEDAMKAATAYLEREWRAPPPQAPSLRMSDAELARWGGLYVAAPTSEPWVEGLDLFLPLSVTVKDGGLQSRDSRWSPVSPALFADGRSVEPTRVFLETAEGTEMVTNLQTKQKVSRLFAFTKTAYWYGLMPLSLLATGVASLFWIVGALRKRVRGGRAWLVRLVPGLAVYAAPALIVALVSAMSTPDPNLLGVASPSSVVVFALSLLAPASAVAALLVMLKSRGVAGAPARLIGWLNTGVALAANLYFLHHGLLALRTWVL